jgi:S-(hydroxymethyl)glutathione dehydrogenase/alcohol dehydrogenase
MPLFSIGGKQRALMHRRLSIDGAANGSMPGSSRRVTPIPAGTEMKTAALFGCAVTTGFGVVQNNAKLKIGESIVVYGAGGIGLNMVQAASMVSADPIIAVDVFDSRVDLARTLGATHGINASTTNAEEAIRSIVGSRGLDVFVDNTGLPAVIQLGYAITKPQGRIVLVGVPKKGNDITIHSLPIHFGKSLIGSFGGEAVPHEDIPRLLHLLQAGKLDLASIITHTDSLLNINEAIAKARSGAVPGRSVINLQ